MKQGSCPCRGKRGVGRGHTSTASGESRHAVLVPRGRRGGVRVRRAGCVRMRLVNLGVFRICAW